MKMGFWNYIIYGSLNCKVAEIATRKSMGHAGDYSDIISTLTPFVITSSVVYGS